jgi:hypothetical protein
VLFVLAGRMSHNGHVCKIKIDTIFFYGGAAYDVYGPWGIHVHHRESNITPVSDEHGGRLVELGWYLYAKRMGTIAFQAL